MSGPSAKLNRLFKEYQRFHATRGNVICHYIGIPMILITLFGLLALISTSASQTNLIRFDGGMMLWVFATGWSLWVDWRIGLPFSIVTLGTYFFGRTFPLSALWTFFVLGWIFQGIGHYKYEKKSPAFYKNFEYMLVGPLWIFAKLIGYGIHANKTAIKT